MNTILSEKVKYFLYNHQIPKDFSYLIQSFLITELNLENNMKHEEPKKLKEKFKIYGRTYPIHEVLFALSEYIKFIILNDSRGNYDIKRGFEHEENVVNSKEDYCLYLKYIFDAMGINLDYSKIQKQLGKKRLVKGDSRYGNLIYEFLQDPIYEEVKKVKEKGWIQPTENSIALTRCPKEIYLNLGFKKNGIEAYDDIPTEYKGMYVFLKELNNLHSVQHIHNDEKKVKEYSQNLNLYYDLWFTTKYARAQNRRASGEELKEIETEYERFYIKKGIKNIQALEKKKEQFSHRDSEITGYEI